MIKIILINLNRRIVIRTFKSLTHKLIFKPFYLHYFYSKPKKLYENRSSFPDLNRSEFVDDDNLDSSSGNENHQQQQRRQVFMDSESELSLVEVEIPSGIMTTTAASSQQQQRRRPSSSYSRLESLTSKLNTNVTPPQPAPPIITDSPHSQSGAVKLEKRIRLNYRKQPNLNNVNLLNFGTLC